MTKLLENLYVGNWEEAKRSTGMYVITVAVDSPFIGNEHFKFVDGPGNNLDEFRRAIGAITDSAKQRKTLVHCHGGRSRSVALVVAAYSRLNNCNLCEAYDAVIALHDNTRIHPAISMMLLNA